MERSEEIRNLLSLTPQEVIEKAGDKLIVCKDLEVLHTTFATHIAKEIKTNNEKNKPTKLILPVGPTGQYLILAEVINKEALSLENCWFFFMDEYCDQNGKALLESHPLSFKKIANDLFFNLLSNKSCMNQDHIIFPNENNVHKIVDLIDGQGGIDVCYGGIGIHGHVAFNEPQKGVVNSNPRKVTLNNYTRTINAIRAEVGGNLENFPKSAYTIGLKQILSAKRIELYCRNGSPYDWANTILRIALFGQSGSDYPVTFIRNHPNYTIITDWDTLQQPKYIL
ncbi:MAG: Glucosamine-6-phosphate deaminase [Promethearchaeota archaeon]|nr:MAG: Glucosamine-6-phosphate deaminase [Candidatus Lokiarchaeota archaeon]